jgi:hypothetical protein
MALQGLFRYPRLLTGPAANEDAHLDGNRADRLITAGAVSMAVLVVAAIAILMGIAGP